MSDKSSQKRECKFYTCDNPNFVEQGKKICDKWVTVSGKLEHIDERGNIKECDGVNTQCNSCLQDEDGGIGQYVRLSVINQNTWDMCTQGNLGIPAFDENVCGNRIVYKIHDEPGASSNNRLCQSVLIDETSSLGYNNFPGYLNYNNRVPGLYRWGAVPGGEGTSCGHSIISLNPNALNS